MRDAPSVEEAMRAAFEEHYLPLLRLCMLLSGQKQVAEDIVQEAFVRAAPSFARLGTDEVGPYLRRVVVNLWKNRLRRLRLERRAMARLVGDSRASRHSVEGRLSLWSLVLRLPDRQRACVVLRFYEDLPERAVASILSCSVGTVKSHTARGLARLRKELEDEC
jgi:RNA polymerase sigma-70 factor (sigma-E family)